MSDTTKRKISEANSKTRYLKDVFGEIYEIKHLADFCRERGLNRAAILNLFCGLSNYSQGFVRIDTDLSTVRMATVYTFISPSEEVVKGTITEVSKKHGIKPWILAHLVYRRAKTSKGWKLLSS